MITALEYISADDSVIIIGQEIFMVAEYLFPPYPSIGLHLWQNKCSQHAVLRTSVNRVVITSHLYKLIPTISGILTSSLGHYLEMAV